MIDIIIIIIFVTIGVLFISLFTYFWWLSSPEHIGEEGENRVHDILMQLPDEYYVFKDVIQFRYRVTKTGMLSRIATVVPNTNQYPDSGYWFPRTPKEEGTIIYLV